MVEEYYRQIGLKPTCIAETICYALSQPKNVDVSDIMIRPSKER